MNCKKIIKQVIIIILLLVLLGIIINLWNGYNTEKIEVQNENKVALSNDRASDDIIIYDKENSLFENNRLCGVSLYAYDIKKDDHIFLLSDSRPWGQFGHVTLCGDRIFFQKKYIFGEGEDLLQYAYITKPYKTFDTEIFDYEYMVKNNNIFFVDYDMSMSLSGVKIFDLNTSKAHTVPLKLKQKFYFENVVSSDGDLVYYSGHLDEDCEKNAVLEFNVSTQNSRIFAISLECCEIKKVIKKEHGIMVLDNYGEIFDVKETKTVNVAKLPLGDIERNNGCEVISNASVHKEGKTLYLYCATDTGRIFKVNIENGKFSELINIEEKYDYFNNYFSEKYIFTEAILYENSGESYDVKQKTLYMFDYNGRLLKKRVLQ